MYLYCLYNSHILHIVRNKILGDLSRQNSLQVDFTLCKKKENGASTLHHFLPNSTKTYLKNIHKFTLF